MTEPTKPEPSEGAWLATEEINKRNRMRGHVLKARNDAIDDVMPTGEMAAIIDRETHSAEMRKALDELLNDICPQTYRCEVGSPEMVHISVADWQEWVAKVAALKGGAL